MIADDWPTAWREPSSLEEVSMNPPSYVPVDLIPMTDPQIPHDSDVESMRTPMDSDLEHAFEESRMKKHQEQGATSSAT